MKLIAMLLSISVSYHAQIVVPSGTVDPSQMFIPGPTTIAGTITTWFAPSSPTEGDSFSLVWPGHSACSVAMDVTWVFLFVDDPSASTESWLGSVLPAQPIVAWRIDPQVLWPVTNPTGFVDAWTPTGQLPLSTYVDVVDANGVSMWLTTPPGIVFSIQSAWFVPDGIGNFYAFLGLPTVVTT